jgi:hypothetical protein
MPRETPPSDDGTRIVLSGDAVAARSLSEPINEEDVEARCSLANGRRG